MIVAEGDLKIYSASNDNRVIGNLFDGRGRSRVGVYLLAAAKNLIQANVFTAHGSPPYAVIAQRVNPRASHPASHYCYGNIIVNNVFYNGDAIENVAGKPTEIRTLQLLFRCTALTKEMKRCFARD